MDVITHADARTDLKKVMKRVIDDQEEIIVARRKGESVVVVSLENWNAVQKTLHLLSTPANAAALRASLADLDVRGDRLPPTTCDGIKAIGTSR